jgi:8-oxo-dGTP pyrophosphatase MutT (NUDIX family)
MMEPGLRGNASPMDIVKRLRQRLPVRARQAVDAPSARRAAVLVPLFGASAAPQILFFERTHDVLDHKGEICYPGGSLEAEDEGAVSAALREAHEELALPPGDVQVLGLLDDVQTHVSNYVITPVVGFVEGLPAWQPDPLEVARIITTQLATLREPGVASVEIKERDGRQHRIYAYSFDGNRVWGATGRITRALLDVVSDGDRPA